MADLSSFSHEGNSWLTYRVEFKADLSSLGHQANFTPFTDVKIYRCGWCEWCGSLLSLDVVVVTGSNATTYNKFINKETLFFRAFTFLLYIANMIRNHVYQIHEKRY